MCSLWICGGVALGVWILMNLKSSRADGTLIPAVHPYRRMMPFIMRGRNESIVYYDEYANVDALLPYLEEAGDKHGATLIHALVAAVNIGLKRCPKMNRFVVGRRLYQRDGRQITFSMKRKKLDQDAKLAAVKMPMDDDETFAELVARINGSIKTERSDKKTYLDKELNLFLLVPRPLMNLFVRLFEWLDYHNLLPYSFIENDGMYTSVFIANLGSLKMRAGFHHLYEWGNCPLFMMVGRIEDHPVVKDGQLAVEKRIHIRWSYDERIDDGLSSRFGMEWVNRVLEDPRRWLGCLGDDDHPKLGEPADGVEPDPSALN